MTSASPKCVSFREVFIASARVAPRTTLGLMRPPFIAGMILILPLTQMAFFVYVVHLGGGPSSLVDYVALGNAVAAISFASVLSVSLTTDMEKQWGTVDYILATPANRLAVYLGRGAVPILVALGSSAMALVYGVTLFGLTFPAGAILPTAVSLCLLAVALVGEGFVAAGLSLYLRTSVILTNLVLYGGFALCGVDFPTQRLPYAVQLVSDALPLTWGVNAVRGAFSGASGESLGTDWLLLAVSGAGFYLAAIVLWRVFERGVMRTGQTGRF